MIFQVTTDGSYRGTIEAPSYDKAEAEAIRLYGMTVTIQEKDK
jgi:hypothetical protein